MTETFYITRDMPCRFLPIGFVAMAGIENGSMFDVNDVIDVEMEVEATRGWSRPATITADPDTSYPAEGEAPEVLSIVALDQNGKEWTVDPRDLPADLLEAIEADLWREQQAADYAAAGDY